MSKAIGLLKNNDLFLISLVIWTLEWRASGGTANCIPCPRSISRGTLRQSCVTYRK